MGLKMFLFGAGLGACAVHLLRDPTAPGPMGGARAGASGSGSTKPVVETAWPFPPKATAASAAPAPAAPGLGSDSPNGAERLQANQKAGEPQPADGPDDIKPGLPDFARGA